MSPSTSKLCWRRRWRKRLLKRNMETLKELLWTKSCTRDKITYKKRRKNKLGTVRGSISLPFTTKLLPISLRMKKIRTPLGDSLKGKGRRQGQVGTLIGENLIGKIRNQIVVGILGMGSFTKESAWLLREMNDIICNYLVRICKNTYLCCTPAHCIKNHWLCSAWSKSVRKEDSSAPTANTNPTSILSGPWLQFSQKSREI